MVLSHLVHPSSTEASLASSEEGHYVWGQGHCEDCHGHKRSVVDPAYCNDRQGQADGETSIHDEKAHADKVPDDRYPVH